MLFSLPLHSGTSISFLWLSYFFQQKYKAPLFEKQDRIDVSLPLPNTWYLSSPTQFVDYFQYWPIRGCYQGLYHYWYYYSNTRLQNIICMAMLLQPHLYSFIFTTWKGQQKKKKGFRSVPHGSKSLGRKSTDVQLTNSSITTLYNS